MQSQNEEAGTGNGKYFQIIYFWLVREVWDGRWVVGGGWCVVVFAGCLELVVARAKLAIKRALDKQQE